MLSIQPMSGYDIRKAIDESVAHFWRESYGQIYPTLKQLAAQGLIAPKAGQKRDRANRRVFALTAKGKAQLREWLARQPGTQPPRHELLLKLFFGRLMPNATSRQHVLQFRQSQQELLGARQELIKELETTQAGHPDLAFWLITASYGRHLSHALIAWSDETLRLLDAAGKRGKPGKAKAK